MGLSVVTVCMNRREHLLATVARLAAWPHHDEHLIVDWSSRTPLRREDLPAGEDDEFPVTFRVLERA